MRRVLPGLLLVWMISAPVVAAEIADTIFINGKVVTVDERFTIAQAVAVKGDRVLDVGSSAKIRALAGSTTKVVDLKGKTVIPGLIDNHAHFMRAAEYWDQEVRLDGVTSRKEALDMIAKKARASKPGEWVLVLGGWSIEQFADERRGFTKAELDAVAPHNPVVLQLIYFRIYTNTAGLKAFGIDGATPNPPGGVIVKDETGQPTGILNGGGAVRATLAKLGEVAMARMTENAKAMFSELNRMGMTSYIDMGGRSFAPKYFEPVRALAAQRTLTMRVFYNLWLEPESPADVDGVLVKIGEMKPFQGDNWFDNVG
jgi:predicted amidohydrolase YtcJ